MRIVCRGTERALNDEWQPRRDAAIALRKPMRFAMAEKREERNHRGRLEGAPKKTLVALHCPVREAGSRVRYLCADSVQNRSANASAE